MRLLLALFLLISSIQMARSQAISFVTTENVGGNKHLLAKDNLPHIVPKLNKGSESSRRSEDAAIEYKELELLSDVSDLLTILENYEDAATYHQRIAQLNRSRENFYNIAFQSLLAAINYFEPKEIPYIFPLELDVRSRRPANRLSASERSEKRLVLLRTVVNASDSTLQMDPDFRQAYLTKGLALTLMGVFEAGTDSTWTKQAEACFNEGIKHCPLPKMTPDFLVAKGLAVALQGDKAGATRYWEQAKTIGSYLAVRNLDILQNKPVSNQILPGPAPIAGVEQIEWYPLEEFLSSPSFDLEVAVPTNDSTPSSFSCGMKQKLQSRIFYHSRGKGQYALIQESGPGYRGNSLRGVNLSSKADNVQEAYGVAKRNFALGDGYVWVYPEVNLYFKFNNKSDLLAWGVYRISTE